MDLTGADTLSVLVARGVAGSRPIQVAHHDTERFLSVVVANGTAVAWWVGLKQWSV